jgi:hypothetical protein
MGVNTTPPTPPPRPSPTKTPVLDWQTNRQIQ